MLSSSLGLISECFCSAQKNTKATGTKRTALYYAAIHFLPIVTIGSLPGRYNWNRFYTLVVS